MLGEKFYKQRPELPVLSASTLFILRYVDCEEVENIASFISEIDPNIPYTLSAFYPCYVMEDLPTTSKKSNRLPKSGRKIPKKHKNRRCSSTYVRDGSMWLLSMVTCQLTRAVDRQSQNPE
jgi:pyruvate-formate lyase-activating enzyme